MIAFDGAKRKANLDKHGFDLADAGLVYDAPNKITLESPREGESRRMDIALVEMTGVTIVLVYVVRGKEVRAISLRRASKTERKLYEAACKEQD